MKKVLFILLSLHVMHINTSSGSANVAIARDEGLFEIQRQIHQNVEDFSNALSAYQQRLSVVEQKSTQLEGQLVVVNQCLQQDNDRLNRLETRLRTCEDNLKNQKPGLVNIVLNMCTSVWIAWVTSNLVENQKDKAKP